ncbi:hypothetical protein D1872_299190 [compost metagenome]
MEQSAPVCALYIPEWSSGPVPAAADCLLRLVYGFSAKFAAGASRPLDPVDSPRAADGVLQFPDLYAAGRRDLSAAAGSRDERIS